MVEVEVMEGGEDCCVKVAVHVRPLIGDEKVQGCKDCVSVVPGKPQVRIRIIGFWLDEILFAAGYEFAILELRFAELGLKC